MAKPMRRGNPNASKCRMHITPCLRSAKRAWSLLIASVLLQNGRKLRMVRPPKRQGAPPPHRPLFYAGQVPEGTEHLSWRTPVPNAVLADITAAVRRWAGNNLPSPPLRGRGVGGEGDERSPAKAPHPRPLSPEYRGEGRTLVAAVRRRSRRVDSTENSCVSGVPELALDLIALTIYR